MDFTIFTAPTRYNVNWREEFVGWEAFAARCASPVVTAESAEEFRAMDRDRQCAAKDCGGFVGGRLKDGKRRAGSVLCRTLITLDYDHAPALPMADQPVVLALARSGWTALVYTTHSPREFLWEYFGIRPADPYYRTKANDVAKALLRLGWEFVGSSRHCRVAYGVQKAYINPEAEDAA